jgi:integrase
VGYSQGRFFSVLTPLACEAYLADLSATRRITTVRRAEQILRGFKQIFPDRHIADLQASDVVAYIRALPHSNRTKFNHQIRVHAMLRFHGVTIKADKPRYVVPMPTVYSAGDLARFFSVCEIRQLAYFRTLLMTGLRMQESKWLEWSDLSNGMVHVRAKPPQFVPKTHEERRIPVPPVLMSLLHQMPRRPGTLIFPTASGRPDLHLLRHCKRIARLAGLDETKWSLHGFRRTFCTMCLRNGLDVRTVMLLMGHSDIESTLRYWRPVEMEQLRGRMAAIFQ